MSEEKPRFNFMLAICSHRGTQAEVAQAVELLHLMAGNSFLVRYYAGDAWIDRLRSVAASEFLKQDWADYMIFIDDDIVFMPEHVLLLYEDLKSGYDLIGGGYPTRTGSQLASYGLGEMGGIQIDGQIQEIKWLATGFMGFSKKLLQRMVDELKLPLLHKDQWCESYPFFVFCAHLNEKGNPMLYSEDWEFPLLADTPVLMKDFSWKQLGNINIGDRVIGFDNPKLNTRPYMDSEVIDKVIQKREAYRIVTSNGEIVASPKHPFLVSSPSGKATRWIPVDRLSRGQHFNIPINPIPNPDLNDKDYKVGYLKGIWEGDGTIEPKHSYAVLEMTDREAVDRAHEFAVSLGFRVGEIKQRSLNNPNWKPLWNFRVTHGIKEICNQPISSESMARGFLAGIYDAEGSYSEGKLRIANKSESVSGEIRQSLGYIGIPIEPKLRPDLLYEYTLCNQESCHRFWQMVSPAITRKISMQGQNGMGIMQYKKAEILSVENTHKLTDLMCITTTSHNFIANGFASHNCEKAKQLGVKTYMDTKCMVGHIGNKVYTLNDVVQHNQQLTDREKLKDAPKEKIKQGKGR
jgi:hypothetical protein